MGFVAFGKVLSPQYLIWPIPFVAVLGGQVGRRARLTMVAACILTTLVYPWAIQHLMLFEGWAVLLLNVRNALLIGLWADLSFGPDEGGAP